MTHPPTTMALLRVRGIDVAGFSVTEAALLQPTSAIDAALARTKVKAWRMTERRFKSALGNLMFHELGHSILVVSL